MNKLTARDQALLAYGTHEAKNTEIINLKVELAELKEEAYDYRLDRSFDDV